MPTWMVLAASWKSLRLRGWSPFIATHSEFPCQRGAYQNDPTASRLNLWHLRVNLQREPDPVVHITSPNPLSEQESNE